MIHYSIPPYSILANKSSLYIIILEEAKIDSYITQSKMALPSPPYIWKDSNAISLKTDFEIFLFLVLNSGR